MKLALVLSLVACGDKSEPKVKPPEKIVAPVITLENLISADAIGVTREPADAFAIMHTVRDLVDPAATCWADLQHRVTAGHQVSIAKGAYFIAEGDLPRADVVACATKAFPGTTVRELGDQVNFDTPGGTVHAVWRGTFLLFGSEEDIAPALATTDATAARWRALIAPLTAPTWVLRIDATLAPLIGESSTDYAFVMDKVEQKPRPLFAGRFVVHYATPEAAAKGAELVATWTARGKWPVPLASTSPQIIELFDGLAAAIAKMKRTQTGTTLEIAFDLDMLGGPERLAAMMQSMEAALPARR